MPATSQFIGAGRAGLPAIAELAKRGVITRIPLAGRGRLLPRRALGPETFVAGTRAMASRPKRRRADKGGLWSAWRPKAASSTPPLQRTA